MNVCAAVFMYLFEVNTTKPMFPPTPPHPPPGAPQKSKSLTQGSRWRTLSQDQDLGIKLRDALVETEKTRKKKIDQ